MSDKEKGLPAALEKAMPKVTQAYCCQHIADNVQQRFSLKCRPLFWACAQARSKEEFHCALKALMEEDVDAKNYVNAIDHKL
jgi:transposase-like protein